MDGWMDGWVGVDDDRAISFDEFVKFFESSLELATTPRLQDRGPIHVFLGGTCGTSTWRSQVYFICSSFCLLLRSQFGINKL
jgi:hypothetical protein